MEEKGNKEMSFLGHLEALRWHLIRSAIAIAVAGVFLFFNSTFLFDTILFGPRHSDFITYRAFCKLSHLLNAGDALCFGELNFELISTRLAGQFMTNLWLCFMGGIILACPYILYEIWRFIKPALYENESKKTRGFVFFSSVLFILGILFSYFIIFPLTINFLGNYEVSAAISNKPTLDDYISLFSTLTLATGIVFELPVIVYFLTYFGLLTPSFMKKFRKHAVVVILLIAAIITPSPDISSQLLVALPLYILYEISIFVSAGVLKRSNRTA